jgi:hypothetical protein
VYELFDLGGLNTGILSTTLRVTLPFELKRFVKMAILVIVMALALPDFALFLCATRWVRHALLTIETTRLTASHDQVLDHVDTFVCPRRCRNSGGCRDTGRPRNVGRVLNRDTKASARKATKSLHIRRLLNFGVFVDSSSGRRVLQIVITPNP